MIAHAEATGMHYGTDEEGHSVLEDGSGQDETEEIYEEDDTSPTLSVPTSLSTLTWFTLFIASLLLWKAKQTP